MSEKLKVLEVSKLFTDVKYEIPIYQRNYAWGEKQIQQLIDDIYASKGTYFLGNLIVNQKEVDVYEVIDGQQRLTTLYLLQKYLRMHITKGALHFEARKKSNRTLSIIGSDKINNVLEELQSEELKSGYSTIEAYFHSTRINEDYFKEKLKNVQLIRIQVPQNIDLNHYFEIMNTRGEQLEFHEIAKAKLLSKLSTNEDKKVGAIIWDACSNMDSYVQMNFDSKSRNALFSDNWCGIDASVSDFDKIKEKIVIRNDDNLIGESRTLLEILRKRKYSQNTNLKMEEENERFESIISFPNFILQVNEAISHLSESESMLDDKEFLNNIKLNWETEETSKVFLYKLLKCRVLFDKYILKREYAKDERGRWSLQRLESYRDEKNKSLKPKYVGTFGSVDNYNKQLRTLQSCLRITYTSPKTMHWISLILKTLLHNENDNILEILEEYCVGKIKESRYENASGFGFERIVFTYLDYILYRDGYSYKGEEIIAPLKDDWQFQFRNSIEHFYPQNPSEIVEGVEWSNDKLNSFGNLALINISGNSKFSNLPPEGKVKSYPSIFEQSLKLKIMRVLVHKNDDKWTNDIADIHKKEMFGILNNLF